MVRLQFGSRRAKRLTARRRVCIVYTLYSKPGAGKWKACMSDRIGAFAGGRMALCTLACSSALLTSCAANSPAPGPRDVSARPNAAGSAAPSTSTSPSEPPKLFDGGQVGIVPQPIGPVDALGDICTPGHYVGTFSGTYKSAAWFNGALPVEFSTADFDGKPGFEFWLEATETLCPPGIEFCPSATVKGGKLRGYATPFSDPNAGATPSAGAGAADPFALSVRFEVDLTGELDCTTGKFRGKLENGCYDVLTTLYRFGGTMQSNYEHTTKTFKEGTWEAKELPMDSLIPPDPTIGGSGVWNAKFTDDSKAPGTDARGLCDGQTGLDTP